MLIVKTDAGLHSFLQKEEFKDKSTGFVPTMGALHNGHISLIEAAKKENDIVICSIFVNPIQFNNKKDFQKYPVTLEKDIEMLEAAGCSVLFLPNVSGIYPDGTTNLKNYNLGFPEKVLEGQFRPGHFQGVCQVVDRLLQITKPDNLYIGQKDYQQCMVISRLVEITGMKLKINIIPTLRENDGLAMSSRNMRLSPEQRKKAATIFEVLSYIKNNLSSSGLEIIKSEAAEKLILEGFRIDYISIADAETLEEIKKWDGKRKLTALIAAFIGEIRLIDNMILN